MKKSTAILLRLAVAVPLVLLLMYSRFDTQDLILQVTTPGFNPLVKKVTWLYIETVGGLKREKEDSLSPLHFALGGCTDLLPQDPDCARIVELLIKAGYSPNALSNNALAVSPIHSAAAACAPGAIEFLVAHGADVNVKAGGTRYAGMTPLRFVREFKTPCAGIDAVVATLKKFGAHE